MNRHSREISTTTTTTTTNLKLNITNTRDTRESWVNPNPKPGV